MHFLSHTHKTQKICCFFGDLQIISLSFLELSYHFKVAKNAGAFISMCSELLGLVNQFIAGPDNESFLPLLTGVLSLGHKMGCKQWPYMKVLVR